MDLQQWALLLLKGGAGGVVDITNDSDDLTERCLHCEVAIGCGIDAS